MGKLNKEQLNYFEEFGFLPVNNVFNPDEVTDPIIGEYQGVLDNLAEELFEKGKISSKFEELPFGKKLTKIMQETHENHAGYFDFSLPLLLFLILKHPSKPLFRRYFLYQYLQNYWNKLNHNLLKVRYNL